jgi:hypothetical protein
MDHLQVVIGVEVSWTTLLVALILLAVGICIRHCVVGRRHITSNGSASLGRSQRVTASFHTKQGSNLVSLETNPVASPQVDVDFRPPLEVTSVGIESNRVECSDCSRLCASATVCRGQDDHYPVSRFTGARQKYYVVRQGRRPSIYLLWADCKLQVDGFRGARYKSFRTLQEVEQFMIERF